MKKIRNAIILLIIIIIIILSAIIILMNGKYQNDNELIIDSEGDIGDEPEIMGEEVEISEISTYKTVEDCIQQYYDVINTDSSIYYSRNDDNEFEKMSNEEINENIMYLLSEEYIKENNINNQNLDKYITKIEEQVMVVPLDMKEVIEDPIEKVAAYGLIMNLDYEIVDTFFIYVNLDILNKTYSIEPVNTKYNDFDEMKITNNNISIEDNDYNIYEDETMTYEDTANEYMNIFKRITMANTKLSYNYMNQEYSNKKFENYDAYQEYIENNYDRIEQAVLTKYKVNYGEEYVEFICIDKNGYYYIFRQKSPLDFDVMLDAYTLDMAEFIERYNDGNEQIKVGMNINKIILALNDKDYNYIYDKLDKTFKNQNFKNINELKTYLQNNLFDINEADYSNFSKKGNDVYTYELTVKDADSDSNKKVTIIMQLLEETDFVMSFNIED